MDAESAFFNSAIFRCAKDIAFALLTYGYQTYFAGGCVRDYLLGIIPRDIDIATAAHPDQIQAILKPLGKTLEVGKQFGVIIILYKGYQFEVSTFRSDGGYTDGRRPNAVQLLSDEREDVLRRDFTINGMMLNPITYEVLDYVGGQDDLRQRCIRAIGDPDKRFSEDVLRLMRAVRFTARFDFFMDPQTSQAVVRHAPSITRTSWERIYMELEWILTGNNPHKGVWLLYETGLLQAILPEVACLRGIQLNPSTAKVRDALELSITLLKHATYHDSAYRLALLVLKTGWGHTDMVSLDSTAKIQSPATRSAQLAEKICLRLRTSTDICKQVIYLVENHSRFQQVQRMRTSRLKQFMDHPWFDRLLALHKQEAEALGVSLDAYHFCIHFRNHHVIHPPELISGKDLCAMGMPSGKAMGRILHIIRDLQLQECIHKREEALKLIEEKWAEYLTPN
jgi:poly(A) polymerase